MQQLAGHGLVHVLAVGRTGEETCLCQIGHGHVGPGHHPRHGGGEVGAKAGIELAVVRHGGVHEDHGIGAFYRVKEVQHLLHLGYGGDVAGIQRIEVDVLGLPVGGDGVKLVRQVAADKAGEGGVGAEDSGGHDGALHAQSGDHRQRHGQGTAAQAGDILYGCDTFHGSSSCFVR